MMITQTSLGSPEDVVSMVQTVDNQPRSNSLAADKDSIAAFRTESVTRIIYLAGYLEQRIKRGV